MNAVTVCSKCKVAGLVQCDSAISCASCEGTGKVLDADRRDYHGDPGESEKSLSSLSWPWKKCIG
jgi:uncharacterized Zn finger protein (UPF0148 family)